jgi:DNA-binding NtrC family response regulator
MGSLGRVLIADPDSTTRGLLRDVLVADGYDVNLVADRGTALALVSTGLIDIVITEIASDIAELIACAPRLAVVLIASTATLDEAVAACRRGAYDYVLRPFYAEDLSLTVACALASRTERRLDQVLAHVRKNHELLG